MESRSINLQKKNEAVNYGISKKFTKKSMEVWTNLDIVQICLHFHTFLCKFFMFLNAFISVKTTPINTKLGDFANLGVLFLTMWIDSC